MIKRVYDLYFKLSFIKTNGPNLVSDKKAACINENQ